MKIAILAAGENRRYFPLIFNKPKCLYHLNGSVKLGQVIDNAKQIVSEKDIIVVAGSYICHQQAPHGNGRRGSDHVGYFHGMPAQV